MKRVMQDLLTYNPIISYAENSFLTYIYPYLWYYWIDFHDYSVFHMVFKFPKLNGYPFKYQAVTIGSQEAQFTI